MGQRKSARGASARLGRSPSGPESEAASSGADPGRSATVTVRVAPHIAGKMTAQAFVRTRGMMLGNAQARPEVTVDRGPSKEAVSVPRSPERGRKSSPGSRRRTWV